MENKNWCDIESEIYHYDAGFKIDNYVSFIDEQTRLVNLDKPVIMDPFWQDYNQSYNTWQCKWFSKTEQEKYANTPTHKPALKNVSIEKLDALKEELPHFENVIDFYIGHFLLDSSRSYLEYQAPFPVLLLGDAGIGKTYFAQKLSQILNTGYQFIDSNSITASWVLGGSSSSWKDAAPGLIFKTLLKSPTASPLIVFDEIDKLSAGKNYDPYSTFHQLLEPNNAREFTDEYLEAQMDASKIIYVLTANEDKNISTTLLSRMQVFNVRKPNANEMRLIAQKIYQQILGSSQLFTSHLSEAALSALCVLTPREARKAISENIFQQATRNHKQAFHGKAELIIEYSQTQARKIGF